MTNQIPAALKSSRLLPGVNLLKEYNLYLILLLLLIVSTLMSGDFLTADNLSNLLLRCSFNGLISLGMTFVILVSGIDLSVGAIFSFAGVFLATMLHGAFFKYMPTVNQSFQAGGAINPTLPLFFLILLVLLSGAFFGLLNGLLITKAKMQAFAATLGIMVAVRGLAFTYSGGFPIPKVTEGVMWLGNGEIAGIPVPVVIWLTASVISFIVLRFTVFGQSVYATGAGVKAAWMSGLKVDRVKIKAYMISGFFSALAGLLMVGRMNAAEPREGSGYELDAIAAVVIGGTLLTGGKGSVLNTIAGVIILGLIANILNLVNVPPYPQQIVKGFIILAAVLTQRLTVKNRG